MIGRKEFDNMREELWQIMSLATYQWINAMKISKGVGQESRCRRRLTD